MNNFTCVIIDDEPQAIELLSDELGLLYKSIEVVATYTKWTQALEALRAQQFDIVFLDISMQDRNGMDLLALVPGLQSEVVFITAYSNYALDAYRLAASGYILKPVETAELVKTVDKILDRLKNKKQMRGNGGTGVPGKLGIPDNNAIDYVNLDDIIYLRAEASYTCVVTKKRVYTSSYNLQKFISILDAGIFYQVQRSYVVNLSRVCRYEHSGMVTMDNEETIPVSKNFRDGFLKLFNRVNG